MSDLYNDTVQPFFGRILADLRGYDPRLFLRWNRSQGWWEVWRWRESGLPPRNPTPYDIDTKAAMQFTVLPEAMDARLVRRLYMSDLARFSESLNPDEIARNMEAVERAKEEKEDKRVEAMCLDWAQDNARQMRRDIQDQFSGYSP